MPASVVTGASGFVGRVLMARLGGSAVPLSFGSPAWREGLARAPLAGATIYHLAARAHEGARAPDAQCMADNRDKTEALARAAAQAGARRLVFLSTIKVNGERTEGRPFTAGSAPAPADGYARSKWAAEQALADVARQTGLEVAIVRPPLVYGPGAGGNLRALLRLCDTALPLPFASLRNRRSLIDVEDLAGLLVLCASHDKAAGRTFLAAHPHSVGTGELVAGLRHALGRPARLFPLPAGWIEVAASLVGAGAKARRLTRSLEVDASETGEILGWRAARPLEATLAAMARHWRESTA